MNSKKPLRSALKSFLQENNLTEQEAVQLRQMLEAKADKAEGYGWKRFFLPGIGVAAICLTFMLMFGSFFEVQNHAAIQERIAHEVLTNHLKIKTLDIETDSITVLRSFFSRLEFSPFFSSLLKEGEFRLLGARYCTLQGVVALQFRLLSSKGEVVTYYQALYDQKRFGTLPDINQGDTPKVIYEQHFAMTIWKEDNVVTVLANADHPY